MLAPVPALRSKTARKILGMIYDAPAGRAPSIDELADACGVHKNAIHGHLHHLRDAGLITWEERMHRTLRPACRWIPTEQLFPPPTEGVHHGEEE